LASDGKNEHYQLKKPLTIVFPNNYVPVGQRMAVLLEPVVISSLNER
jgi:succinylglutamate desuccinylase